MLGSFLSKYISRQKGHVYSIDERIPDSYLLFVALGRIMMKLRGAWSGIKYAEIPFIGRRVTVKAASRFRIGKGVTIASDCYIDALSADGICFGDYVSMGRNTKIEGTGNLRYLGKGMKVGAHVGLGSDNFFGCAGGITIGDDTIIGNFVSFHSENHVFSDMDTPIRLQGVTHKGIQVGSNCWIGAKVTILDGAVIEPGCVIAACSLVAAGVYKADGIYAGIPAKFIKNRNQV